MSWIRSKIIPVTSWVPQVTQVRFRYFEESRAKGPLVRRFGYSDPINIRGLLPREDERRIRQLPIYRPKDRWSVRRALFGQNDYVDILGDDSLNPTRIQYITPSWLRGVKGNEMQLLIRKKKIFSKGIFPISNPTRWNDINKQIKFLYKFLNRKTKTFIKMH
ncbi:39S ribosomal protein L51, mitochondrial [Fopius arisanus]|uniref:Large ribosomal subunit protein mL51 n=1 Tax=Fopius arisanus TaxID=64838 RepID=A0A9R1STU2_9HYME|nr:PREDICTED: 39S ribosomal protein L51, mitochondrial [Fopius arisanus]XP_011297030.1 PREDICTED: 39S ribosomal protein L51, mitochondrial [Fopius arisanus]